MLIEQIVKGIFLDLGMKSDIPFISSLLRNLNRSARTILWPNAAMDEALKNGSPLSPKSFGTGGN